MRDISPAEVQTAFEEGMHFDGSAIDGFSRIQESDVLARPDPSTFELLPWADGGATGRMFCDIYTPSGEPFWRVPPYVTTPVPVASGATGSESYRAPLEPL